MESTTINVTRTQTRPARSGHRPVMVRAPFRAAEETLPPGVRWVDSLGLAIGRVFSYNRVSSGIQVRQGTGLARQAADSKTFCELHGLELDETLRLVDPGRSAFKGEHLEEGADLRRFLDLAKSGQLGPRPMLIIEAVDRVSRVDMFDALNKIFLPLLGAGVTIYDLDDREAYNEELVRSQGVMPVMRLALRIDEAHKKSARLKERITRTWEIHRELMRSGVIKRPKAFCPSWCDYDEETQTFSLNAKAASVKRAFELLRHYGFTATARILNEEGHPPLRKSEAWTKTGVTMLLRRDQVYGAIRLHEPGYWTDGRQRSNRLKDQPPEDERFHWEDRGEVIENFLPAVLSKSEVLAVRALVRDRAKVGLSKVRNANTSMHWFGQRLSFCACGETIENHKNWCSGEGRHVRYLRCRRRLRAGQQDDCARPGIRMEDVSAHVLARLSYAQLAALGSGSGEQAELTELKARIQAGEDELRLAKERQSNFNRQLTRLMEDGADVYDLLPRKEQIRIEIAEHEAQLAQAQAKLVALSVPRDYELAAHAVNALRLALIDGESTPEQRCAVNNVLREFNLKIHIDSRARLVGLQVGSGDIDWQPLAPAVAREAVAEGMSDVDFVVREDLGAELAA